MEADRNIMFLFDITNAVKHFYETPVIFVTRRDYSDNVFNVMCRVRSAIQQRKNEEIIDALADFHLGWLHAVNEIDNFKKRTNELTKEEIYQAISFTIDSIGHRLKYYQKYMEKNQITLPNIDKINLSADLEIVEDMHKDITHLLLEKLKCYRNFVSAVEFKVQVNDECDELLNWLDKIHDEFAFILSKYINKSNLNADLTNALQQIVRDMQNSKSQSTVMLFKDLKKIGQDEYTMIRGTTGHNIEINKVIEKIAILEDRIQRLEQEPSSAAVMALQNKKEYFEKRLCSLEDLKISLKSLHHMYDIPIDEVEANKLCACEDYFQFKIFNHLLPTNERERLVTQLCYLWDLTVFGDRSHKSLISILSATDMKEEFVDELGTYYVDGYSRKIYKLPDDHNLYQPNERNELVPLQDDSEHIYFFDECGRYFIDDKTKQRVYKAHPTASEYLMDSSGVLLKIKEERDGNTFYYDNYGRYYINEDGKHIYREVDSTSEYESDGLGNLVRIRSHSDLFEFCPDKAQETNELQYLKQTVGAALRQCIAKVILYQPADPINYLSACLIKYRENLELEEKRAKELEELKIERDLRLLEEKVAAERTSMGTTILCEDGSEVSYDSNLIKYTTIPFDEAGISANPSSK